MDRPLLDVMQARHSVRAYRDTPITGDTLAALQACIEDCNRQSGLHIQLVREEPRAFDGFMAHYGKFSGVKNYIAMVGKKGPALEQTCGYWGQRVVLQAQALGLNTCWVAMTFAKVSGAYRLNAGEKLCCVIAIGYGRTQGAPHKIKTPEQVSRADAACPDWFRRGVQAALLAPTAMNQQKFTLTLQSDGRVQAKPGAGFYTKLDLGIVKCHFELGSGKDGSIWA